jgi:uncharacterized protein (UPF0262 family)
LSERLDRLVAVDLDDHGLPAATPEIEQERRVAIFDLLDDNRVALRPVDGEIAGPYRLKVGMRDRQLSLTVSTEEGEEACHILLSLAPFSHTIKDYFAICESYFDAVRRLPPAQIETFDVARKRIHDEAARMLLEKLEGKLDMDLPTARRLFTLICVLHARA